MSARRGAVLKNDQVDGDTGFVLVAERLQSLLDRYFNILPPDCEYLSDGAVADHFAHHSLVHITERFVVGAWANAAHFEQVLIGIRDAILHDPVAQNCFGRRSWRLLAVGFNFLCRRWLTRTG